MLSFYIFVPYNFEINIYPANKYADLALAQHQITIGLMYCVNLVPVYRYHKCLDLLFHSGGHSSRDMPFLMGYHFLIGLQIYPFY